MAKAYKRDENGTFRKVFYQEDQPMPEGYFATKDEAAGIAKPVEVVTIDPPTPEKRRGRPRKAEVDTDEG